MKNKREVCVEGKNLTSAMDVRIKVVVASKETLAVRPMGAVGWRPGPSQPQKTSRIRTGIRTGQRGIGGKSGCNPGRRPAGQAIRRRARLYCVFFPRRPANPEQPNRCRGLRLQWVGSHRVSYDTPLFTGLVPRDTNGLRVENWRVPRRHTETRTVNNLTNAIGGYYNEERQETRTRQAALPT